MIEHLQETGGKPKIVAALINAVLPRLNQFLWTGEIGHFGDKYVGWTGKSAALKSQKSLGAFKNLFETFQALESRKANDKEKFVNYADLVVTPGLIHDFKKANFWMTFRLLSGMASHDEVPEIMQTKTVIEVCVVG